MAFAIAGSTALAIGVTAAGVGAAAGGISALSSNAKRKKAEREMDALAGKSPLTTENKGINDYYREALSRYKENPFTTPYYLETTKQADRAATQQLASLQTRGAAIGGAGRINRMTMDAKNRGMLGALQNKSAQFAQLGGATQMSAGEKNRVFDINQMTPYNRKFGLAQYKTQAANEAYNRDKQSVFNSLGNLASLGTAYGSKGSPVVPPDLNVG